jgi:hypothetical protein
VKANEERIEERISLMLIIVLFKIKYLLQGGFLEVIDIS